MNGQSWYRQWWGRLVILFLGLSLIFLALFSYLVFKKVREIRSGDLSGFQFTSSKFADTSKVSSKKNYDVVNDAAPSLGPKDAKVTIVEFGDFSCPYTRQAFSIIREISAKYKNQVRIIWRDYPITEVHPYAFKAAQAGRCANEQGKFWPYYDRLFQNPERQAVPDLKLYAQQVGLNETAFNKCLNSDKYAASVENDMREAIEAGVPGTPTWFINGRKVPGVIPLNVFEKIIELSVKSQ